MKERDWISEAVRNKGAFTEYCKRKGHKGVTKSCIKEALKSPDETTKRRARLAEFFKNLAKKRSDNER